VRKEIPAAPVTSLNGDSPADAQGPPASEPPIQYHLSSAVSSIPSFATVLLR
tara:strand:- start:1045 stop:1200 length:156 start_codon:yes stop_codon:yes gene_type:complete